MEESGNRAEAERWLGIAEKLLMARDLIGSKRFAVRAQERDPLLDGIDQILAVADVLLASEKRINNHFDWYAILQIDSRSNDLELIKRQYRRLALLLHPDKNKSVFADNAFKLVSDAWAVLSDPSKKSLYDNELNLFLKFDPISLNNNNQLISQPVIRRSAREKKKTVKATEFSSNSSRTTESRVPSRLSSFWTACPYCYNMYEYPRVYEDCCLRCQNCRRAFHATVIPSPPNVVSGKEAYYCCWAFFPIGFSGSSGNTKKSGGLPNWVPFSSMFPFPSHQGEIPTPMPMPRPRPQNPTASKVSSDKEDDSLMETDVSDESWDSRAEKKKGKAVNDKKSKTPKSSPATKSKKGNVVERVEIPEVAKPQKKMKKTARKQTGRPPNNKTIGGRSDLEWIDMDLNVEVKADVEEPEVVRGEGEELGNIDEDATEGIGFFEGLDDILGSLPILSVPEDQKVESA